MLSGNILEQETVIEQFRLLADRLFILDVLKEEVSVYEVRLLKAWKGRMLILPFPQINHQQPAPFQVLRQVHRSIEAD